MEDSQSIRERLQREIDAYDLRKILLTSDLHFSHANIILPTYCDRPFDDVHHMNVALCDQWNEQVDDETLVLFLGDFAMGPKDTALKILPRLRGRRWLIIGNHDNKKKMPYLATGFEEMHTFLRLEMGGVEFNLSHFPYRGNDVDKRRFPQQLDDDGRFLLCGHVHNAWRSKGRTLNVGWDAHRRLITAEEAVHWAKTGELPVVGELSLKSQG